MVCVVNKPAIRIDESFVTQTTRVHPPQTKGTPVKKIITRTAIAASAVGIGAAVLPAVAAAPANAATTTPLCSFTYANPNLFAIQASAAASATRNAAGKVTFTLKTNSMSILGYQQALSVTWANLDTGRSGVGTVSKRVVGPETVLTVPEQNTAKGRVNVVINVDNRSSIGPGSTNGQCAKEFRVS